MSRQDAHQLCSASAIVLYTSVRFTISLHARLSSLCEEGAIHDAQRNSRSRRPIRSAQRCLRKRKQLSSASKGSLWRILILRSRLFAFSWEDDFEPWRQQVCSILQIRPGLRVVAEIADGLEAVQKAKELQPDLILLDIGLPNLNGLEAANRIRQVAPSAKILFLTQNNDQDMVRAALNTGAQGYVLKTDAGRELLPAVAGVLGGDDFVSSGIKGADSGETERQVNAPPTLNEKTQSPVAT